MLAEGTTCDINWVVLRVNYWLERVLTLASTVVRLSFDRRLTVVVLLKFFAKIRQKNDISKFFSLEMSKNSALWRFGHQPSILHACLRSNNHSSTLMIFGRNQMRDMHEIRC